jgi:hypothetical protein
MWLISPNPPVLPASQETPYSFKLVVFGTETEAIRGIVYTFLRNYRPLAFPFIKGNAYFAGPDMNI